jgi:gamma-glutamyl-gamma-aminobutyrate hydrolase PuuD
MPVIGVTASTEKEAEPYLEALSPWDAEPLLLLPGPVTNPEETVARMDGLLVTGGADIDPSRYGASPDPAAGLDLNPARDEMELPLLKEAIARDIPVLAICRGMQALNVVVGGSLIQDLRDHRAEGKQGLDASVLHHIWISPGSKLAAILGSGGKVRVNSIHHQGLREAQKSPNLMASAYSLEDRIIEGLESPYHRWVVAVQCHPEIRSQLPKHFQRLFERLVEEARLHQERRSS